MPRIQRRSRLRERGLKVGCTKWQLLLWGALILPEDGPEFMNNAEMEKCWRDNREELFQGFGHIPGRRPFGFWKFEIREENVRWPDELRALMRLNLLTPDEIFRLEKSRASLSDDLAAWNVCDTELGVTRMLGAAGRASSASERGVTIRRLQDELSCAEAWHRWRGRRALAEAYARRVAIVDRVAGAYK